VGTLADSRARPARPHGRTSYKRHRPARLARPQGRLIWVSRMRDDVPSTPSPPSLPPLARTCTAADLNKRLRDWQVRPVKRPKKAVKRAAVKELTGPCCERGLCGSEGGTPCQATKQCCKKGSEGGTTCKATKQCCKRGSEGGTTCKATIQCCKKCSEGGTPWDQNG
jgi:hypothetical protein